LYGDPQDMAVKREVMRMLDDATLDNKFKDTRHDEAYSRWENVLLEDPNVDMYLVNDYDNHEIHAQEHNLRRKSMEYQKVKVENPQLFMQIDSKFSKHIGMHQKFIADARRQALEEQMMLTGKGGKE